jgi:V8-like Glu-specific endopeptidase
MAPPHNYISAIIQKNKKDQIVAGSGIAISKNIIFTAAHNIYHTEIDKMNGNIICY